jgi:hypothetical protein
VLRRANGVVLGACRHCLARRVDRLGEGGRLLLLLLQGFSQVRRGDLRRLLLLHGLIDSLLRLRGLCLEVAACSSKLAYQRSDTGPFLLKGLPQLLRWDFRCLAALHRFVVHLVRQRQPSIELAARRRRFTRRRFTARSSQIELADGVPSSDKLRSIGI